MSGRLIPAYVERPAWDVYKAYNYFLDTDDFERMRIAVTELRDALVRGNALTYAPDDVLLKVLNG